MIIMRAYANSHLQTLVRGTDLEKLKQYALSKLLQANSIDHTMPEFMLQKRVQYEFYDISSNPNKSAINELITTYFAGESTLMDSWLKCKELLI